MVGFSMANDITQQTTANEMLEKQVMLPMKQILLQILLMVVMAN